MDVNEFFLIFFWKKDFFLIEKTVFEDKLFLYLFILKILLKQQTLLSRHCNLLNHVSFTDIAMYTKVRNACRSEAVPCGCINRR